MSKKKAVLVKAVQPVPGESARPAEVVIMPSVSDPPKWVDPSPPVANDPDVRKLETGLRKLTHFAKQSGLAAGPTISQDATDMILKVIDPAITRGKKQKADATSGGNERAAQQKKLADTKAQPIYDAYKQVLTNGTPQRKAIAKTTNNLQQIALYNKITQRQVRRAVDRLKKKDSS